ncbi:MAG: LysR family transcriptional regulator [Maricaulis sp.]|jgi:DNA-binding transcriptional LysR family regulator|nr:LysR family transcriptional regulator [Maricaulis sp.]HAQ36755.1 LysR family transcriptional regulator [Alphaproteobacteria bacterium]
MDRIDALRLFAAVAELGSFTKAAAREDMTPGAASKQITALEGRMQARLLERTTRSVRLTDAGSALLERIRPWLAEYESLESGLADDNSAPAGLLRISAPVDFGARRLMGPIAEFMAKWPGVEVRMSLADRMVDLVDEGFDLAVRIGQLSDSTLIAKRLAGACMTVVASPAYLKMAGTPSGPDELARHDCIVDRNKPAPQQWIFTKGNERAEVRIGGRLTLNGATAAIEAAAHGAGIACSPMWAALEALETGRVVRILPDWEPEHRDLWAVYPSSRYLARRVRLFVDHLATSFDERV